MVTKLHRDALASEVEAVRALIAAAGDRPSLNSAQLKSRLNRLEQQLNSLDAEQPRTATVAIIFDGRPVKGSSSIDADFAGKALQSYQELITKQVANNDFAGMAQRGPIPQEVHDAARMDVSGLVHGSFGFVLQEGTSDEPGLFESSALKAVSDISDILSDLSALGQGAFEARLPVIDARMFSALKRFVTNLHKAGSSLKISEPKRDVIFDGFALERAHNRLKETEVSEDDEVLVGELLGLVPIQRRFDFRVEETAELIQGKVSQTMSEDFLERIERDGLVAGRRWRATVRTRTVEHPDERPPTVTRTLIDLQDA